VKKNLNLILNLGMFQVPSFTIKKNWGGGRWGEVQVDTSQTIGGGMKQNNKAKQQGGESGSKYFKTMK